LRVGRLRAILLIFIPTVALFQYCFAKSAPHNHSCHLAKRILAALSPLINIPQVDDMLSIVYVAQDRSRH